MSALARPHQSHQYRLLILIGVVWVCAACWLLRPLWPAQEPQGSLQLPVMRDVAQAVVDNLPALFGGAGALAVGVTIVYVLTDIVAGQLRLLNVAIDSQARIKTAAALAAEAAALQRQAQAADLSMQEGRIVPRLVRTDAGKLALVNAALGTSPVQEIDPDVATSDHERLRALAIMTQQFGIPTPGAGPVSARGGRTDVGQLALFEYLRDGRNGAVNALPGTVRILEDVEAQALPVYEHDA